MEAQRAVVRSRDPSDLGIRHSAIGNRFFNRPLSPLPSLGLAVLLVLIPQTPRTALGRCAIGPQPAASYQLPGRLREVSGLAAGSKGELLTHSDERGTITLLDGATLKPLREIRLKGQPRDDFEGIAAAGDSVALMTSTGKLYLLRITADSIAAFTTITTGLGAHCELEGLGWHRASGTLLFPCKQPKGRAVAGLTLFRYRLGPTPGPLPPIHVTGAALSWAAGTAQVRATSVEVDPATGHLLVLSSKPPLVLEVDTTGRPLAVKQLPARQHPQAEGLTLTSSGMWIADEGTARDATLTRYACR